MENGALLSQAAIVHDTYDNSQSNGKEIAIQDLLSERGITVSFETILQMCLILDSAKFSE
jgi:hypothetical protein